MFNFMKHRLSLNDTVKLTPSGMAAADNNGEGAKYLVIGAIKDNHGVASINEIAQETRLSSKVVEQVTQKLIRGGYVQPIRGGEQE